MRPPNSDALTVTLQVFLSSHFSMILYIGSAILIVFLDSLQLKIAVFILKHHYPINRRNFKRCSPNAASATVYVQLISTLDTLQDMLHICWKCSTCWGFCCSSSGSSSCSCCYKSKILCSGCSKCGKFIYFGLKSTVWTSELGVLPPLGLKFTVTVHIPLSFATRFFIKIPHFVWTLFFCFAFIKILD